MFPRLRAQATSFAETKRFCRRSETIFVMFSHKCYGCAQTVKHSGQQFPHKLSSTRSRLTGVYIIPLSRHFNHIRARERAKYESVLPCSKRVAGLQVTSRRPCWWSRTKVFLSAGNWTLFWCKFSRKISFALTTNMAALSRGCKPRIAL